MCCMLTLSKGHHTFCTCGQFLGFHYDWRICIFDALRSLPGIAHHCRIECGPTGTTINHRLGCVRRHARSLTAQAVLTDIRSAATRAPLVETLQLVSPLAAAAHNLGLCKYCCKLFGRIIHCRVLFSSLSSRAILLLTNVNGSSRAPQINAHRFHSAPTKYG